MSNQPTQLSSYLTSVLRRGQHCEVLSFRSAAPYHLLDGGRVVGLGSLPLGSDVVRAIHEECLAEAGLDAQQNARSLQYHVEFAGFGCFAARFVSQGRGCRLRLERVR